MKFARRIGEIVKFLDSGPRPQMYVVSGGWPRAGVWQYYSMGVPLIANTRPSAWHAPPSSRLSPPCVPRRGAVTRRDFGETRRTSARRAVPRRDALQQLRELHTLSAERNIVLDALKY